MPPKGSNNHKTWYNDLWGQATSDGFITYSQIEMIWPNIERAAAAARLTTLRKAGYIIPEIKRERYYGNNGRLSHTIWYGVPDLPECPKCKERGYIGVHYEMGDGEYYCPNCGYDPGWGRYRRRQIKKAKEARIAQTNPA